MTKILDYEEMIAFLNDLDKEVIKENPPIGYSTFKEPIRYYTYGHGSKHVILTAGTHSAELITNVFLLNFMSKLSHREISIAEDKYTLHFIPIINPEGTIIVTSAIRNVLSRGSNDFYEQLICLNYYLNSRNDDNNANIYKDQNPKLIHQMFKHASIGDIDDKYLGLKQNLKTILPNLPEGIMINWTSNGEGVDLNSNIEVGEYFTKFQNENILMANLRLNEINRFQIGPLGCPSKTKEFVEEPENTAILNFYKNLIKNHDVIGSFIFHSCGGEVHYLDFMKESNYWNSEFGIHDIIYNRKVAQKYADVSGYKLYKPATYTTFCSKLRSILPGTLVIEIGQIRSNPLSQFIDLNLSDYIKEPMGELNHLSNHFTNLINKNTKAILETITVMDDAFEESKINILVNKNNPISKHCKVEIMDNFSRYNNTVSINKNIYEKWIDFKNYAFENNYDIDIESGYRNINHQEKVLKEATEKDGKEYADKYVAMPGFSEHHTGLAIDICLYDKTRFLTDEEFSKRTDAVNFIAENAYKFGFIVRYPKGKEDITGYSYEPWHLRYVGKNLSEHLYKNNLTLEEYYLKESEKNII